MTYWAISTKSLVETALSMDWTSDIIRATHEEFKKKYQVNDKTASMLYRRLVESNDVCSQFRQNDKLCGQRRWIEVVYERPTSRNR